jgi:hypothetical protein
MPNSIAPHSMSLTNSFIDGSWLFCAFRLDFTGIFRAAAFIFPELDLRLRPKPAFFCNTQLRIGPRTGNAFLNGLLFVSKPGSLRNSHLHRIVVSILGHNWQLTLLCRRNNPIQEISLNLLIGWSVWL